MDLLQKIKGTVNSYFQIGLTNIIRLVNTSGILEIKDGSGALIYARVKSINDNVSTPNLTDVGTYIDVIGRTVALGFSFAGGSAPSAGTNTGKFGFCHTSGGSYTAGLVYYDTGSTLLLVRNVGFLANPTGSAITGTVSLNALSSNVWNGTAWINVGDGVGSSSTGNMLVALIDFDYTDIGSNVETTTSIPDGAIIHEVKLKVNTLFNATTPTAQVTINGSSPVTVMATTDNDLTVANEYVNLEDTKITSTGAGVVRLTLAGTGGSAGAGYLLVMYSETQNV